MPAYVILDVKVTDPETYSQYKDLAPAAVATYGGIYLARGGRSETLEGDWLPGRMVILQFPSLEKAKTWLSSPEYAPARALRNSASITRMVVVEGIEP
jgi:uncharacterized protein (DUF1330 family)